MSLPPQAYKSPHSGTSSGRTQNYVEQPNATITGPPSHSQLSADPTKPRTTNRILGDYTLSKVIGKGSTSKVKLARHNISGEKLAVKILPRVVPIQPVPGAPNAEAVAKQATKDASKEVRMIREAVLSQLLYHPYICGMREMITHRRHYYLVFEYINGVQLLDYIISHGRLRESFARKFARQIGSALEYCHKNNVVHRDLKIENIFVSRTGNIKIIDFWLSGLYDPASHLSTFCGSLYFAAPEVLNAKVYTGPEVDVWSFGVVFMPALHAKINRGLVEYPMWLSAGCKRVLSRMLVTNPQQRASLPEVLNHPWMARGFNGPPDPHLVQREPLRANELDRDVIRGMTGFEFGTEEEIEHRLVAILESEAYKRAVQNWESKRVRPQIWSKSLSNSSIDTAWDSKGGAGGQGGKDGADTVTLKKNKRSSWLGFYRRKLFSPSFLPPSFQSSSSSAPKSQLPNAHLSDFNETPDPTHGYHPLISIYYLTREKLERDRVYGPGHFFSPQPSSGWFRGASGTTDHVIKLVGVVVLRVTSALSCL
ncbi:kinase-like domain-containing protein [Lactarius psammicola]|nr:kinase-like domain-containing protein [Lactarius psammicola]